MCDEASVDHQGPEGHVVMVQGYDSQVLSFFLRFLGSSCTELCVFSINVCFLQHPPTV